MDSWVGVPGTTLTNWPDENIHSSGDDLWQMDATQLKRNAFIVAATALWLADAGGTETAALAPFVTARSLERIARDAATAAEWMRSGKREAADRSRTARNLLDASIASLRALGPSDTTVAPVLSSRRNDQRKAARMIRDSVVPPEGLDASAGNAGPSDTERRLEKRVPKTDAATIARRVCAETLSAGAWYYGECTPEMVEKFFETEAKDGLIMMAPKAPS